MNSQTPSEKALGIAEIFINILSELDHSTLLTRATRVNRHWHYTIFNAPELQRVLFLPRDNQDDQTDSTDVAISAISELNRANSAAATQADSITQAPPPVLPITSLQNPFLERILSRIQHSVNEEQRSISRVRPDRADKHLMPPGYVEDGTNMVPPPMSHGWLRAFLRKDASWRTMRVCTMFPGRQVQAFVATEFDDDTEEDGVFGCNFERTTDEITSDPEDLRMEDLLRLQRVAREGRMGLVMTGTRDDEPWLVCAAWSGTAGEIGRTLPDRVLFETLECVKGVWESRRRRGDENEYGIERGYTRVRRLEDLPFGSGILELEPA